jgi:RNA polymerase sigma-70 factor (family 1)
LSVSPSHITKELLQSIADGDEGSFAELYRSYVPKLEPFIKRMTKDEVLVEEVIQDTFTRLWMNRARLSELEFPHTYILRTASYVCVNYLRRSAITARIEGDFSRNLPWFDNSAETTFNLKALEATIRQAIQLLTPAQQNIYRLSREEGLKIPEIAARLNISPNTVKNTLVTSLKSIREYAGKAGYPISLFFCWIFI